MQAIPGGAIAMRLKASRAVDFVGSELTIELTRNFDQEWLMEDPRRRGYIHKLLRDHTGRDLIVVFKVAKDEPPPPTDGAVELPLEGQKLEQLAREIFGNS
jgi:hypothetical protein